MSDDQQRPPKKRARIDVPIDQPTLDDARKKAGSLRRLRAVIRALLSFWLTDEYRLSKDDIAEHERRAKKVSRKKK